MAADVLIVYASKHGSTEQVARGIGEKLRGLGLTTAIERAGEVEDLSGYRSVLVGGSIYMGRWHHDARGFLNRHRPALERLPFAVFALGPGKRHAGGLRGVAGAARSRARRVPRARAADEGGLRRRDRPREAALPVQPHAEARPPRLARGSQLGGGATRRARPRARRPPSGAGAVLAARQRTVTKTRWTALFA